MAFFRLSELQPKIESTPRQVNATDMLRFVRDPRHAWHVLTAWNLHSTCRVSGFHFGIYIRNISLSRILDCLFSQSF